jgi:NTP pyrophosphatase (non-canonical NTP hydrolase)
MATSTMTSKMVNPEAPQSAEGASVGSGSVKAQRATAPQAEIQLPEAAPMSEYQRYIYALESMHGWLSVDLVNNCFLLGEEVGELFKAIRKHQRYFVESTDDTPSSKGQAQGEASRAHVAEELVDVFNYLLAIANRLDIDLEEAFRHKNAINQGRTWS